MKTMNELEVLELTTGKLDALGLPYMLTGSFALAYYAKPRMTRDIDLVLEIGSEKIEALANLLSPEFYVDPEAARQAIAQERLFNLMHYESGLKVDLIVRKSAPYRQVEFNRRQRVTMGKMPIWIVSREDLILSKLDWMRITPSELQRGDIQQLLDGPCDLPYLRLWAPTLGVERLLADMLR
jgi:hypothetical protein